MEYNDTLVGKNIHTVLDYLKSNRVLVRMKLIGKDYEQLIIIHDIRNKANTQFFIIDYPKGISDVIKDNGPICIQFEFTGADNLPYLFTSVLQQIYEKEIWITFPDTILRKQLRKDFRVEMPSGTKMSFKKLGIKYVQQLVNLSLGGSYGALIRSQDGALSSDSLLPDDLLTDIEIVFRSILAVHKVNIRKAVVVRCEDRSPSNLFFALHFLDVDKAEEKALTELIYFIQREYLKKRLA